MAGTAEVSAIAPGMPMESNKTKQIVEKVYVAGEAGSS
ncbi:MAG: hypothetical protein RL702_1090 [Pseudomonadota bacterium]|jgi:hypothetical protein